MDNQVSLFRGELPRSGLVQQNAATDAKRSVSFRVQVGAQSMYSFGCIDGGCLARLNIIVSIKIPVEFNSGSN
jgi:hypothetical protein